jgi:hypothetical protein
VSALLTSRAAGPGERKRNDPMYTPTLQCGTLLSFEAPSLRPRPGNPMPCRQHGYRIVVSMGRSRSSGRPMKRARPRVQRELLEWLRERSEASVHSLRRQRFSLRMIAEAEREGLVDLDLLAGRVVVRSLSRPSPNSSRPDASLASQVGQLSRWSGPHAEAATGMRVNEIRDALLSDPLDAWERSRFFRPTARSWCARTSRTCSRVCHQGDRSAPVPPRGGGRHPEVGPG